MEEQIRQHVTTLSIKQQNAIDLLALEHCDLFVADKVGVARQTVNKWRLYHPQFKAELGRRREEIWAFSADKIRLLIPQAIDIVERSLDDPKNPDRLKLAVEILKQSGIFATLKSRQLTDADDIINQGTPIGVEKTRQPNERDTQVTMKRILEKLEDSDLPQ
jgi:hypothetical protein